ncbi:G2/mitotic-specific cyclin-1-like protein [Corchorus olitorius]|uniref:G2/mitotic-specific cyclin-1-like protein n=1 Tax=Corchorus olitorius TaxID=93759 RepID=A0A1R3JHW0_9ROSI|nr:G2/mitotic-specific cyclin-1-like protein [Corchorus olitorius]
MFFSPPLELLRFFFYSIAYYSSLPLSSFSPVPQVLMICEVNFIFWVIEAFSGSQKVLMICETDFICWVLGAFSGSKKGPVELKRKCCSPSKSNVLSLIEKVINLGYVSLDCMAQQSNINEKVRAILIDRLIKILESRAKEADGKVKVVGASKI